MMSGPFSVIDHNKTPHYSIQLEIYRYSDAVGRKVKTNDLWLLLQKANELVQ
jgi:hypothetical protein